MALADHNYSAIEKHAIKALQAAFNLRNNLLEIFSGNDVKIGAISGLVDDGIPACVFGGIVGCLIQKNVPTTKSPSDDLQLTISNSFLEEVEDILRTIAEIQVQMKNCDGTRLANLQKSCDEQTDLLKDKILSEEN